MMREENCSVVLYVGSSMRMFVWNSICGKETERRANGLICHMG